METPFLLHPSEQVSLMTRQSAWAFFFHIVLAVVWLGAAFFVMPALLREGIFGQSLLALFFGGAVWFGLRLWRFLMATKLFFTTQRLVYVHTKGLLSVTTTEMPLSVILSVSVRRNGLGSLLFRYGALVLEHQAGKHIVISRLPHPQRLYDQLSYLISQR